MTDESVVVIGAGIAGLTSAALLAHEGVPVTLLESHSQVGGCAGTFRRGSYLFDVGATQVAGLEIGGIHQRLFRHLSLELPVATILDPACVIDLADGMEPIALWHNKKKWEIERKRQFPGSEPFWTICKLLHESNWKFSVRDPVIPTRNFWDLVKLIQAFRLDNIPSGLFIQSSVVDLLKLTGCYTDKRLIKFLDLQLRLYSQTIASRTSALYGATVLQMAQEPHGLWHLDGSMQVLSDLLRRSFCTNGGQLLLRHKVVGLKVASDQGWKISVSSPNGLQELLANDVVFTLPPQSLLELISDNSCLPSEYVQCLRELPKPSGALVFYAAIARSDLPDNCPNHLQINVKDPGSLFISVSRDGDGRAPLGEATLIASIFTQTSFWCSLDKTSYVQQKEIILEKIVQALYKHMGISYTAWIHKELATPRSFVKWTGRPNGIVGGLAQYPERFGLFGLASRTPVRGLWLCGDSIYPGEGTAGVSHSALIASRQLMANRGLSLNLSS